MQQDEGESGIVNPALRNDFENAQTASAAALPLPSLNEYREFLDEYELSEEQKHELLQTLWWIMVSFVDVGFGIDSVQRCLPALEEISLANGENALEQSIPIDDARTTTTRKEPGNDHD